MNDRNAANAITPEETRKASSIKRFGAWFFPAISIMALLLIACRHFLPSPSTWPQGWMNSLDAGIVKYINRFSDHWPWLNLALRDMEENNILKGGPVILLFWIAFFEKNGHATEILERRRIIAATIPIAVFGVILARILAEILPFRERPLRTIALHFQVPHALRSNVLYGWSSFPSDHAVLFISLAVGLFIASRVLGTIALLYTFILILLPRIYLGLHWPTDILGGAAIGAALASIVLIPGYKMFIWKSVISCWQHFPGIFAAFIFLLSYEIIALFGTPLEIAKEILKHFAK